jgi:Arc/MetJ family transcription regulator
VPVQASPGYGTKYGTNFRRHVSMSLTHGAGRVVPCLPQFATIRSSPIDTPMSLKVVYDDIMARTNININETLIRKAQKLTRLKTKREIVDRALELLVRSEDRKSILRYHGSGIWKGNYKLARRNRV